MKAMNLLRIIGCIGAFMALYTEDAAWLWLIAFPLLGSLIKDARLFPLK